jgi:hypothetical protein
MSLDGTLVRFLKYHEDVQSLLKLLERALKVIGWWE